VTALLISSIYLLVVCVCIRLGTRGCVLCVDSAHIHTQTPLVPGRVGADEVLLQEIEHEPSNLQPVTLSSSS
jgi:hypothetical protein